MKDDGHNNVIKKSRFDDYLELQKAYSILVQLRKNDNEKTRQIINELEHENIAFIRRITQLKNMVVFLVKKQMQSDKD